MKLLTDSLVNISQRRDWGENEELELPLSKIEADAGSEV